MILLFGSTGYIGKEFAKQLTEKGFRFIRHPSTKDITYNTLELMYSNASIDYVINAAGFTGKPNVDACELDKYNTLHGNVVIPQIIASFCRKMKVPFGHVSSGCIYSGRKNGRDPFIEFDEPNFSFRYNNCSFYSGTKALAEEAIQKTIFEHHIWRMRLPFEEFDNSRNYISKVLNYTKLLDVENSISNKQEFVNACIQCMGKKVPYGIYNIVNTNPITTRQVAEKIKNTIAKDKQFEFFDNEEEFYSKAAKTPRSSCVLDNSKLLSVGIRMQTADEALDYCLNNWKK